MGVRGLSLALDAAQAGKLLAAEVEDRWDVFSELEEAWDEAWVFEHDKAWDALHRCLGNGTLDCDEPTPLLQQAVLGGDDLMDGDESCFIRFVPADRVPAVAKALEPLTRDWFDERFSSLKDTDYDGPGNAEDREYTWAYFEELRELFRRAAQAGRAVAFNVNT